MHNAGLAPQLNHTGVDS